MPPKFVPRQRKHRVIARQKQHNGTPTTPADANAAELLPVSISEREERRESMRKEIRAQQPEPKVSGKKRKRLDKYIDTKLKREENLELIKKLAAHKVDTSLFASSKKLGRGGESQRERLERALREKNAGINLEANDAVLFEQRKLPETLPEEDDSESEEEDKKDAPLQRPARQPESAVVAPLEETEQEQGSFGSGLKRPLELDENGKPVLQKRKRRKVAKTSVAANPVVNAEPAWDGFSSDGDDAELEFDEGALENDDDSMDDSAEEDDIESQEDSEDGSEDDEMDEDEESDSSEESDDESSASSAPEEKKARSSAFKAWATQQRNTALGFTPSTVIGTTNENNDTTTARPASFVPREPSPEPLPAELAITATSENDNRPAVSVLVPRSEEIQEARLQLPVVQEEQKIMEAINRQDVIVVWGATGSGKTTQVPQMMFESGYGSKIGAATSADETAKTSRMRGMIGVTQPRRVAAVSVAERVGTELCEMKDRVGYQIRFDTTVSKTTAIKFMTDGILLREIANDFILSKYSAIVIDEAHERSVNTDILIGMMSRIVDLRAQMAREKPEEYYPLKLVIMSATLRIEDFTKNPRLFRQGPPPIVQAEGRQYPVTVHFARRTQRDYLDDMFSKISRGHKKLPPGGMLVFLTGQNEITTLAKRLRQAFPSDTGSQVKQPKVHVSAADTPLEIEDLDTSTDTPQKRNGLDDDGSGSEDEIHGLDDDEEDDDFVIEGESAATSLKVHVLPLYSQLPTKQQMKVFEAPPEGSRLIVLATNVAETSLTIPGIRYVFDCGRSKEKKYEPSTGVQTFEVDWISKASASQRSGRAGRTGPGHCYRLYSSAVFERDFEEYAVPEILRSPIEGVVLSLKSMDIQTVVNFPFPTPPDRQALAKAEKLLTYLGAIDAAGKITDTGKELAAYPLNPRFARMLLLGQRYSLTTHTIALVAALAVPELFVPQTQYNIDDAAADSGTDSDSEVEYARKHRVRSEADNMAATASEKRRKAYGRAHASLSRWDDRSDALKLLTAIAAYSASASPTSFCEDFFIREKGMKEASQLRTQLSAIVRSQSRTGAAIPTTSLPPPDDKQRGILKQLVAAGFIDQVAIRADLLRDSNTPYTRKPRRATEVPYRSLFASHALDTSLSPDEREAQKLVFVHPSSVLSRLSIAEMPEYIVYSHLSRATAATVEGSRAPKTRMHPLTAVSAKQLARLAEGTPLLEVGKPMGGKVEQMARGEDGRERRACWVGLSLKGTEGLGWPVGTRKVVQMRVGGNWVTESVIG